MRRELQLVAKRIMDLMLAIVALTIVSESGLSRGSALYFFEKRVARFV